KNYLPYAGMAETGGPAALQTLRDTYADLFPPDNPYERLEWSPSTVDHLNDLLRAVRPANSAQSHELDLLRCKIELRAAQPSDSAALETTRACFETFLKTPRPAAFASEARGWPARTYF